MVVRFAILFFLMSGIVQHLAAAPGDSLDFARRLKTGIANLKALDAENEKRDKEGRSDENFYFFTDEPEPIEFFGNIRFVSEEAVDELNEKLVEFNEKSGKKLYVKLTGGMEWDFSSSLSELADNSGEFLNSLFKKNSKFASEDEMFKDQYEKAKKIEAFLTTSIHEESGIENSATLGVSLVYGYKIVFGEKQKIKFVLKSLAMGDEWRQAVGAILSDTEDWDLSSWKEVEWFKFLRNEFFDQMTEEEKAEFRKGFKFSVDPDIALGNYVAMLVNIGNGYAPMPRDVYGNVVYLVPVTSNVKTAESTEVLKEITRMANRRLEGLKVETRVALFEPGVTADFFDFNLLAKTEGVAFIGGNNIEDAKDFQDAVLALQGDKKGIEYENNKDFALYQMDGKDPSKPNFLTESSNPEVSAVPNIIRRTHHVIYNRIALHYLRRYPGGASNIISDYREQIAFSLVHGIGHNSELEYDSKSIAIHEPWNHYGGICTDGKVLEYVKEGSFLELNKTRNQVYVKNFVPTNITQPDGTFVEEDPIYSCSKDNITKDVKVGDVLKKDNFYEKEEKYFMKYTYGGVENNIIFKYKSADKTYTVLNTDFRISTGDSYSAEYKSVLEQYPSLIPNHSYRYSVGLNYGRYKARVNPKLGNIYY